MSDCDEGDEPVLPSLPEVAAEVLAVSIEKGFVAPNHDNLPVKLLLVLTEVDEAIDAALARDRGALRLELADIAIRLLGILGSVFPLAWDPTIVLRRSSLTPFFGTPEAVFRRVSRDIRFTTEAWRVNDWSGCCLGCTMALCETFRIADACGIDLRGAIAEKTRLNRTRPFRHGGKKQDG